MGVVRVEAELESDIETDQQGADMDHALSFYKEAMLFEPTSESPYWSTLRVSHHPTPKPPTTTFGGRRAWREGLELGLHPAIKKGTDDSDQVHPFDAGSATADREVPRRHPRRDEIRLPMRSQQPQDSKRLSASYVYITLSSTTIRG